MSRSGTAVVELLAAFAVVFLLQFVAAILNMEMGLFVLRPPILEDPWTVVTSVYAHDGIVHLLSNAVALALVGWPVASATTKSRFHLFFVVTGAIAGISQIVLSAALSIVPLLSYEASPGVWGASGAVFALLGYLLASNRLSNKLTTAIEIPPWVGFALFVVVAGVITYMTAAPRAALIAHFVGLFLGLVTGRLNVLYPPQGEGQPSSST